MMKRLLTSVAVLATLPAQAAAQTPTAIAPAMRLTSNGFLTVPYGGTQISVVDTRMLPGLTATVPEIGTPGFFNAPTLVMYDKPTSIIPQILRIQRNDNINGSAGTGVGALDVACNTNVGESGIYFCNLTTVDDAMTDANSNVVPIYGQIHREVGASPAFGAVFEMDDYGANSTGSSVSEEVDMFGHSTDNNHVRIGIDIVGGYVPALNNGTTVFDTSGTPQFYAGVRIGGQNGSVYNAGFAYGLVFNPGTYGTLIGALSSAVFTYGIDLASANCATGGANLRGFGFISTCAGGVGVGNTSPQVALDVYGGSLPNVIRVVGKQSTPTDVRLSADGGFVGTNSASDFLIEANGQEHLRAQSGGGSYFTGNLGIGATPAVTFDVQASGAQLRVKDTNSSIDMRINAGGGGLLGTYSANDLVVVTNGAEAGRFFNGGGFRVGAGSAALPAAATVGDFYLPTSAGLPTGSVGNSASAALRYDTTDGKLCANAGVGWKCVALN